MSDSSSPLTFATQNIEFEPSTGYVGTAIDFMPEPVTSMSINSYVRVEPNGRIIEGYWLCAMDSSAMVSDPQPVMHTSDFLRMSRLCAMMFDVCGRPSADEVRVGMGYTAYYNELARRLDADLPEGPVNNLACSVSGYPDRGVLVRFSTADATPTPIAAIRGCLGPQGMHTLARGFRDMAEWRLSALAHAGDMVLELGHSDPVPRREAARTSPPSPRSPNP
jgi:hypothetical protein